MTRYSSGLPAFGHTRNSAKYCHRALHQSHRVAVSSRAGEQSECLVLNHFYVHVFYVHAKGFLSVQENIQEHYRDTAPTSNLSEHTKSCRCFSHKTSVWPFQLFDEAVKCANPRLEPPDATNTSASTAGHQVPKLLQKASDEQSGQILKSTVGVYTV